MWVECWIAIVNIQEDENKSQHQNLRPQQKPHHLYSHRHTSNTMSKFHTFLFANQCSSLHPELAPNVQKNDDTNERERGDEDLGRSDLQTRAVVGVKLQDVLSATGPAAATGRCCASLCWSLLRPHDSRKQASICHSFQHTYQITNETKTDRSPKLCAWH